jgi:PKD domain
MRKYGTPWALTSALLFSLVAGAHADRVIYRGEAPSAAGIRLTGWGSGIVVDAPTQGSSGSHSLRVSVDGYYSGGRILFNTPLDLTADVTNPNAFLELVIQFQPAQIKSLASRTGGAVGTSGGAFPGGGPSGPAAGNSGGFPGGFPGSGFGPEGGAGPGGFPGGFPGGDPNAGGQPVIPDTRRLRAVLVFEGAQAISHEHPLITFPTPDAKWVRVAIPFAKFKSTAKLSRYMLKEIRLFGDSPDTFFVGEIRTVTDTDPISVEPLDEQVVAVNDNVVFSTRAEAGLSALEYSWDFDASDGIQEDAVGPRVYHTYQHASPENAPYKVTVTVTDMAGVKKAERITTTIEVIP